MCWALAGTSPGQGNGDWTPPETAIRQSTVNLGKFLLEHGMADPRGGQFGVVKVVRRSRIETGEFKGFLYNGLHDVNRFGWLVDKADRKRFIGVDGLEYPVRDFEPKDLAIAIDRALQMRKNPNFLADAEDKELRGAINDLNSDQSRLMVLISGNMELAEKLSGIPPEHRKSHIQMELRKEPDEIRGDQLQDFVRSLWQQAIVAHMRGEAEEAVRICRVICANRKAYTDKMASADYFKRWQANIKDRTIKPFEFLDFADSLQADNERRLREGPKTVDLVNLDKLSQPDRIAKLIDYLDQVGSVPESAKGSSSYWEDPIVTRLFKEGKPAADALIGAMCNDTRLTSESDDGWYPGVRDQLPSVKAAAAYAFYRISGVNVYGPARGWMPSESELRAIWAEWKDKSVEQRWLCVLKDNRHEANQFREAARYLGATEYDERFVKTDSSGKRIADWSKMPKRFESLNENDRKELAHALIERSKSLLDSTRTTGTDLWNDFDSAFTMAFLLNEVSPKESWPLLRECVSEELEAGNDTSILSLMIGSRLSKACCLLAAAGDKVPTLKYLARLTEVPSLYPIRNIDFLALYYLSGEKAEKLVARLICNSKSKFNLEYQLEAYGARQVGETLNTPLVKFEVFREEFIRLMLSKKTGGKVENEPESAKSSVLYREAAATSKDLRWFEAENARRAAMRPGDGLALAISQILGAPQFKMHWPVERKDKAKKELAAFLNKHWRIAMDVSKARLERM